MDNYERVMTDLRDWIDYGDDNSWLLNDIYELIISLKEDNDNLREILNKVMKND